MYEGITASIVFAVFLVVTSVTFLFLTDGWTELSLDTSLVIEQQRERVATAIAISSASEVGLACTAYAARVNNTGAVTVSDFSEMDLLVDYVNTSDAKAAAWLTYSTDWFVARIAPGTRDPNVWNPGETATINFTLPSAAKGSAKGTVLVATPLAISDSGYFTCTCTAGDSGFSDPAADAADTGGDGDGYELNPSNAFADGSGYASNLNGDDDRHRFYNYGFAIHSACAISGIEVRLDWWLDATGGNNSMDVELSWDAGTSWTVAKTDSSESTTEHTVTLGSSSDTWGRTWSVSDFTDANFRVRATMNGSGGRDHFLDWIPVKVHYAPP